MAKVGKFFSTRWAKPFDNVFGSRHYILFHLGIKPKYFILQTNRDTLVGGFRLRCLGFYHDRFSRIII